MSDLIEGMARAVAAAWFGPAWIKHERQITDEEIAVQKAALLWLADNVSDEMVAAALRTTPENLRAYKDSPALSLMIDAQRHDISAAIRAAGDGR